MHKPTIVLIGLLLAALGAQARGTVCTLSINSNEEIEVFKRNLQPQGFDFVELTDGADPQNPQWFDRACKRQVQCDILLVSGHFGGTFFGKSGLQISMEHLNANRCMQFCDGILKHPKEVFLFGCNTLAGKDPDSRTPEQYIQVLEGDGIPMDQANRIAAARYSPLGFSYRSRMLQVFAGVPMVHGFDSVSPSGPHVAKALQKYFDRVGDYSARLRELKSHEISNSETDWDKALSLTHRVSAPGAGSLDHDQCGLYDPRYSTFDRLQNVEAILNGKDIVNYIVMIGEYLLSLRTKELDRSERKLYLQILEKSPARSAILGFLPNLKPMDPLYSEYYRILSLWPEDPIAKVALLAALRGDDTDLKFNLASQFPGIRDPEYVHTLERLLVWDEMFYVRIAALQSLATSQDPEAQQAVQKSLQDENEFVRKAAAQALKH